MGRGGSDWHLIKGRECQVGEGSKENAHHLCWSFIPDSREVSSGTKTPLGQGLWPRSANMQKY